MLYVKLTRLDNTPIWLNASFIVTVEPRKGGGAVVVPIGDGLDYDVKESPEAVLAMLGAAEAPAVVPIPSGDALAKTPEDVSPESEPEKPTLAVAPKSAEEQPVAEKPAKKVARKPRTTRKTKKPALTLTSDQVDRLKKMMPGSVKKLQNTLVTQFKIEDADAETKALVAAGLITLERDRVIWNDAASA